MNFTKPKIIISKCLEFAACRYDGQIINNKYIAKLKHFVDFIPICPEVEIGLGTPRDTIRIIKDKKNRLLYQPETDKDFSKKMNKFSKNFLNNIKQVDGFILKSDSPSCGVKSAKIYPKKEDVPFIDKGNGFFTENIQQIFPNHPIEEDKRLNNIFLREHFYTSIFTISGFKKVHNFNTLYKFHAKHKYLFMSYNQKLLTIMGNIAANKENLELDNILKLYYDNLLKMFLKKSKIPRNINTHMHVMGYFKKFLTSKEKLHFLNLLDTYKDKKIPISSINNILISWINRFGNEYLENQSFFHPFPADLIEKANS
tara:strand:+ start:127 stop:1065 length:939 start_codon:yes stop_codon:yes gene_type:complete